MKSHSSSVEEADANRITSSLKGGAVKAESKTASKVAPAPKEEKVAPKVVEAPASKPTPAKESPKAEAKETPATPKKPQSRNFKAEREARAKAEAERRKTVGDEITVTEINKETIKVNVRIMIVATKMEMVKATVIMGTAVTIVIVTVISKVNSAMIKVEINVTMLPVTIRQDHVLTLKRVQQP